MAGRDTPKDLENAPVFGMRTQGAQQQPPSIFEQFDSQDIRNPDSAKRIAMEAWQSSTNWINQARRLKWNDSLRAFQGLHPANSKYLSTDYRYRSRLFRPKTRAMVRKAEASTAEAFFSNEDVVSVTAIDDDNQIQQASAEINKALLQYRLTSTIPWFLTLVGARQDAEIMGICIGKAYWKFSERKVGSETRRSFSETGEETTEDYDLFVKEQDHPWVDLIASENFRFDPGADWRNPVATSPYIIEAIPMYIGDVMEKVNSGEWLPVSEGAIRAAMDLDDDVTRRARESGRVPGKDHDTWKPRQFDIAWIRENIVRHKGQDWHFLTLSSSGALLTNPRPLKEVYLHGIRPYVCGFILPEAHKVYPSSKVEITKDIQTHINDVTNLRLDNVKLVLNPRQFIRGGQGIDPQDMRMFMPGKVVISNTKDNPKDSILWDRPPEVTASSYQEQDRLNMDFDDLAGGTSPTTMQAMPQVYRTTDNMEMLDGNSSILEEYDQRVFAETFVEPIIKHLLKLEQAYETDATILAIAGQKAQLYQRFGINQITDNLLQQELTTRVNVGIGATRPDKKLNNFTKAAQTIAAIFGPAASMGANFEEITKEVFSACGYKDGSRFFMPGFDVHAAQQQMAQSQNKDKGGEDPQAKIAIEQAKQMAQAQQDTESHKMEMQEMQLQHQFKMEEMRAKFQMEMMKITNKPGPAVNVSTPQLDGSAKNLESMMNNHGEAMDGLKKVLEPLAHVTMRHGQTLDQLLKNTSNSHNALAGAIDQLAKAHLAPKKRRLIRDEKTGKATGVEEYV